MNKKLSLFPMTRDLCAVARYSGMLHGYTLSHLFVPSFVMMDGDDISRLDGGDIVGMSISHYNKAKLIECDALFIDYDNYLANIDICKEVINDATQMGKELILSHELKQRLRQAPLAWSSEPPLEASPDSDLLHKINVPVIMLLSNGLRTDQFAVELALRKYFTEQCYKVGQIGSTEMSGLFGFTGMPSFMFEPRDAYEKTLRFNQYVSDLVCNECPELMIIGAPDSIMKYNNQFLCGLGILPSIICAGTSVDLPILCINYNEYKSLYFEEVSRYCKYHLDSQVRFFNISNTSIDIDSSIASDIKLDFVDLKSDFVLRTSKHLNTETYHLFNALDSLSLKSACMAVHETLVNNARYLQ